MEKRNDRIFIGLILVLIGIYCILKAVGINVAAYLSGWWWILIIVVGLYMIFIKKRFFGGVLVTGIGLVFFLAEKAVITSALTFPIILTLVGVLFLITANDKNRKG